jgi:hypothetical protein
MTYLPLKPQKGNFYELKVRVVFYTLYIFLLYSHQFVNGVVRYAEHCNYYHFINILREKCMRSIVYFHVPPTVKLLKLDISRTKFK